MLVLLMVLFLVSPAFADTVVFYYEDTGAHVQSSHANPNWDPQPEADQLTAGNGRTVKFFRQPNSLEMRRGKDIKIVNDRVVYIPNPVFVQRQATRAAALQKLRGLGLTDAEVAALYGG